MARQNFSIPFKVRDYECDMQGIVNNSVYMNYLEHARHEYLDEIGVNFKAQIDQGVYLVLVRAELNYKKSLNQGENFTVTCGIESNSKLKINFVQEIYNDKNELILTAFFTAAAINEAKKPVLIETIFKSVIKA